MTVYAQFMTVYAIHIIGLCDIIKLYRCRMHNAPFAEVLDVLHQKASLVGAFIMSTIKNQEKEETL